VTAKGYRRVGEGAKGGYVGQAALDRVKGSRAILSSARKAEVGVKRVAPGNYRTRCSLYRTVRRFLIRLSAGKLTRVETFADLLAPGFWLLTPLLRAPADSSKSPDRDDWR
jgi:hypothetical protein